MEAAAKPAGHDLDKRVFGARLPLLCFFGFGKIVISGLFEPGRAPAVRDQGIIK